jgi:hypothetical protein
MEHRAAAARSENAKATWPLCEGAERSKEEECCNQDDVGITKLHRDLPEKPAWVDFGL